MVGGVGDGLECGHHYLVGVKGKMASENTSSCFRSRLHDRARILTATVGEGVGKIL